MTDTRTPSFDITMALKADYAPVETSDYSLTIVYNFPSEEITHSALDMTIVEERGDRPVELPSFDITLVWRSRIEDPAIRVFGFPLDEHEFYGIRLGNSETLILDLTTNQFFIWGSGDSDLWRAYDARAWLGGNKLGSAYGSNLVAGDDGNGSLYFLDPDGDTDDDAIIGASLPRPFLRQATGQVLAKGYSSVRCYGVELWGSIGQTSSHAPTEIILSYSDNRGESYTAAPTIQIPEGSILDRVYWRSLGSYKAPGRLFRISDYGALKRIDSLFMVDDESGN